jgi:cytochrome P450
VTFPKDTIVMVSAFNYNHSGLPDAFDITREPGKIATFGAGIHYCLGANLARAEMEEALLHLVPRMPGLALDGDPEFESVHGIYGLASLPLQWGSAA